MIFQKQLFTQFRFQKCLCMLLTNKYYLTYKNKIVAMSGLSNWMWKKNCKIWQSKINKNILFHEIEVLFWFMKYK